MHTNNTQTNGYVRHSCSTSTNILHSATLYRSSFWCHLNNLVYDIFKLLPFKCAMHILRRVRHSQYFSQLELLLFLPRSLHSQCIKGFAILYYFNEHICLIFSYRFIFFLVVIGFSIVKSRV